MRRKQAEKRISIPDPIYGDVTVAKFIAAIMRDGKKSTAQRIVYGAFDTVEERTGEPGVEVFRKAINNVAPLVEVRSRRVGGATYQVPIEVRPERRTSLAFRWLIQYARQRGDKQDALGGRRLPGVDVRRDPDVARPLEGELLAVDAHGGGRFVTDEGQWARRPGAVRQSLLRIGSARRPCWPRPYGACRPSS